MNFILTLIMGILLSTNVFATSNVTSLAFSSTNITTGAYVTFVASTPVATRQIFLCNTGTVIMMIAVGAAASEVDLVTLPSAACAQVNVTSVIPLGSRLSLKALSGTASTGFGTVSLMP